MPRRASRPAVSATVVHPRPTAMPGKLRFVTIALRRSTEATARPTIPGWVRAPRGDVSRLATAKAHSVATTAAAACTARRPTTVRAVCGYVPRLTACVARAIAVAATRPAATGLRWVRALVTEVTGLTTIVTRNVVKILTAPGVERAHGSPTFSLLLRDSLTCRQKLGEVKARMCFPTLFSQRTEAPQEIRADFSLDMPMAALLAVLAEAAVIPGATRPFVVGV